MAFQRVKRYFQIIDELQHGLELLADAELESIADDDPRKILA